MTIYSKTRLLCQMTACISLFSFGSAAFAAKESATAPNGLWVWLDSQARLHVASEQIDQRFERVEDADLFDPKTVKTVLAKSGSVSPQTDDPAKLLAFYKQSSGYRSSRKALLKMAQKYNVDADFLTALITQESGFSAGIISPAGAVGLMQIMPGTAERFGVVTSDDFQSIESKLVNPHTNLNAGTRYVRFLLDKYPNRYDLVLAAYNAGEGAVKRFGNTIPDFRETQNYVARVLQVYEMLTTSPLFETGRKNASLKGKEKAPAWLAKAHEQMQQAEKYADMAEQEAEKQAALDKQAAKGGFVRASTAMGSGSLADHIIGGSNGRGKAALSNTTIRLRKTP